jgi:hypothetical protein
LAAAAALIVLLVIVAAVQLFPRPVAAEGHQVPIEGNRQHVDQGAELPYRNRPPSSGDHYPTPAGYGVFTRDIPVGNLVHALEHGGIAVYYRADLCDQSCLDQLLRAVQLEADGRIAQCDRPFCFGHRGDWPRRFEIQERPRWCASQQSGRRVAERLAGLNPCRDGTPTDWC